MVAHLRGYVRGRLSLELPGKTVGLRDAMPSGFLRPLVNYRWRVVLNSVNPGRACVALPVLRQKDPDRNGSYFVRHYTNAVGHCVFIWIIREHEVSVTEWLRIGGSFAPVVWISANLNGRIVVSEVGTPETFPRASCGGDAYFLIL